MWWITGLLICCIAIGMAVIKTVRFFIPKSKNGYIAQHQQKIRNGRDYNQYLKWMAKNNPDGIPLNRIEYLEDIEAENKFKELLNP